MKQQAVPFCCACGKVKDEFGPETGQAQWVELRAYRMKHGFRFADLSLCKTYCLECGRLYKVVMGPGSGRSQGENEPEGRNRSFQKA